MVAMAWMEVKGVGARGQVCEIEGHIFCGGRCLVGT